MKKIVIVGGGITGLAAAYTLEENRQDMEYTLIEKNPRLGGKILTEHDNGYLIEGGPDCFLAEKQSVIKLAEKIGMSDRLIGTNDQHKGTYIYSGGKLHALPEGLMLLVPTRIVPFALSPLISWPGKLRMSLDFVLPKKKDQDDETLQNFVLRRLGQEALDKIATPLIGGIHGGDPETMSLKASFPRFLDMERDHGSLVRAMLSGRRKAAKRPTTKDMKRPKSYFMSFKKGMGELPQVLEEKLQGEIIKGQEVTEITRKDQGFLVAITGQEPIYADGVILAVPAPEAAHIIKGIAPKVYPLLQSIPMASSATIQVVYQKSKIPKALNSFGFLVPHVEKRKINAVTFASVKWDERVPNEDYILLRVFIGGAINSHLALAPEEEIMSWVKDDLKTILGITAEPEQYWVHRWVDARPQYIMGHLDRLAEMDGYLQKMPGLVLVGGCYRGIGVPDCVSDGIKGAEKVIEYLFK